jgi:hypothetical protein
MAWFNNRAEWNSDLLHCSCKQEQNKNNGVVAYES